MSTDPETWPQYRDRIIRRRKIDNPDCTLAECAYGIDSHRPDWLRSVGAHISAGEKLSARYCSALDVDLYLWLLRRYAPRETGTSSVIPSGYVHPHIRAFKAT